DYITPIPDTSKTACNTIAEALRKPIREVVLKNRSSLRTFILPEKNQRLKAAKEKYLFINELIQDKKLLIIDDSIIRGLTIKYLIQILRKRNAKEIHVAITNPPTRFPCYYGIDFATDEELIAKNKTQEEICKLIGADSLTYLSLDGLKKAINLPSICDACLSGNYPTPFGRELRKYLKEGVLLPTQTHYETISKKELKLKQEENQ
ncbi:MAG: phosphoribosyltransferase family protein, partial [Candidatus Kariarchaeaceae archaeon]